EAYHAPQYYFTTAGSRRAFGYSFAAFGNGTVSIDEGCPVDYLNISSSAYNALFDLGGNAVGYGKVTVLTNGNGKEEFYYTNFNDHPDEVPLIYHDVERITDVPFPGLSTDPTGPPFPAFTSNFWERGVLFKHEVFAQQGNVFKVVSRDLMEYDFDLPSLSEVEGVTIMSLIQTLRVNFHSPPSPVPVFSLGKYRMVSKPFVQKRIIREIFDQADPGNENKKIAHVTDYSYNPVDPPSDKFYLDLMPRKIVETFANGEKVVTENKYPADYPSRNRVIPTADEDASGIFMLKAKQVDNALIESLTYLEKTEGSVTTKTITGGSLEKFKKFQGTDVFAASSNKLKSGVGLPFTTFPWSRINTNNLFIYPKQNYKPVRSFLSYDGSGSPVDAIGEEGIPLQYTWGNNGSLLLERVLNPGPQEHATQYIHLPLIGLSRITDSNGRNTHYTYDNLKRLKLVRDHDNAIQTRYRYHYQNQSGSLPEGQMTASGCQVAGKAITFSATVSAAYGATRYAWDFDDGSTAETSSGSVSHIFSVAGNYRVKVRRTNPEYSGESISSLVIKIATPMVSAAICAHGMIEVDICGIRPPRVVQCPGGIGPPDILPDQAPVSGIQAPTFKAQVSGSSYRWEYKFKNGNWTSFGASVAQVMGPPGFGSAVGTYSIRCTIKDACGNAVVSNLLYLTVYASKENCPQL
ncbi:MAG TPA: PKD domain-containing protein, partial [Ohtaekwangia sp.]|nr:PKD domain-containing protein [Ohtaekwangia sp.]